MAEVADKGGGDAQIHVDGILKSAEKDEVKFTLLVGLIKADQVSNKDVVNTVLHLLVGGEFEIGTNFIIQEAENIPRMLKVLSVCPSTLQAEIWSVFTAMLKKSCLNLNASTEVGLIESVLRMLEDADDVVADLLVEMLGVLASYSITVKELRMLFALLKAKNGEWPRNSVKLLSVLRQMPQRHGPDEFFSFPGKKGSFISLPPIRTWPYQNGWAFSCWIRLDPLTGVAVEKEKPYLYCFRTSKGVGYSAHFLGSSLVITSMKVKGKGFQHCVKYEFLPRKCYMVTICHIYYRWSRSELRCYVDGELVSLTDMSWLVSTSDPFDKCYLGASSDGDPDTMFRGQMSAVYLFSEYLTANQVSAIYKLGPGYKSQFRFDNENSTLLSENTRRVLYEGRLTSTMVFMYNPIACDSQLCLESSPKCNTSYFVHSPHALMLNDVKAVITCSLLSTLHSLGGIEVLFPLFGQLDMPVNKGPNEKSTVNHSICANLMSLLCDLLESSSAIQEELLQKKGFLVISYLLEKSSREHITIEVLNSFLKLTQYLVKLQSGGTLLKHLFDHILFNPGVWIYASVEVQTRLYCYLATDFINDAQIYSNIRRVSAVLQTMHTLKYYYWVINPKDRSGLTPKGVDGPRPDRDEIVRLRSYMLLYVAELIRKGHGILEDELQSILNYLTTLHEDDNLMDVLMLLVTLMSQHPSSMVPSFDKKNGIRTVFKLLASPSEPLRIQALKLLGFFLMRSTHKRKFEAMNPQNLFSLIGERLMLNMQSITIGTYNVLFEILTERLTLEYCWEKHSEPESYFKLENPAILKVVATMINQSKSSVELMEVKKMFLSDLTIMCNNNKENRRTLLQMSVWQEWLFNMAYIYPQNVDEQKITDMVMSLFRMLLHHAIKFEYGGWRVWVDTLAILHSKVAYEDFRIHMSNMYEQYERQRVDNLSDPEEREQHPISTISGISDVTIQDSDSIPQNSVKISEIPGEVPGVKSLEDSNIQDGDVRKPQESSKKPANEDGERSKANLQEEEKKLVRNQVESEKLDKEKGEDSLPADNKFLVDNSFDELKKNKESDSSYEGEDEKMKEIDDEEENGEKSDNKPEKKDESDGMPAKSEPQFEKDSEMKKVDSLDNKNKNEADNSDEEKEGQLNAKDDGEPKKIDGEPQNTEKKAITIDNKEEEEKRLEKGKEKEKESETNEEKGSESSDNKYTEENKVSEDNDQVGDAHDFESAVEDNSNESDQAEESVSNPSDQDQDISSPGPKQKLQPEPIGYLTQDGEMIFLNIAEDGKMVYQTDDGRLVYQHLTNDGQTIYHTGEAEAIYDKNSIVNDKIEDYVDDIIINAVSVAENQITAGSSDKHSEKKQHLKDPNEYQSKTEKEIPQNMEHSKISKSNILDPDVASKIEIDSSHGNFGETVDSSNGGYRSCSERGSSLRRESPGNSGSRHLFSPGPRAPPFRIPEFRWSYLHQKLLSDLLFSIETDIQVWKSHSTCAVVDFVNSGENHIYVVNVTHMISQLADNLIMSCGGLLPLLAAATSPKGEIDILEPNQGLSIEQAVSILQRIMNMTDIVVFTSSTNFSELEQEKNMPPGGILRQCLRLVCTAAVRNCLECKHRYTPRTPIAEPSPTPPQQRQNSKPTNNVDAIQSLIGGSHPSPKNIVENLGGQTTPIKDAEKLLQDMDITRLRAVVYRDVDETKQAQFLALAIVYFTSVLMVSKYRDILEPPSSASTPTLAPHRSGVISPTSKEGNETDEEVISLKDDNEPNASGESIDKDAARVSVAAHVHMANNKKKVGEEAAFLQQPEMESKDEMTKPEEASVLKEDKQLGEKSEIVKTSGYDKTVDGTSPSTSTEDKLPATASEKSPTKELTTTTESVDNSMQERNDNSSSNKEEISTRNSQKDLILTTNDSTLTSTTATATPENTPAVKPVSGNQTETKVETDTKPANACVTTAQKDNEPISPPMEVDAEKTVLAEGETREETREEGISSIRIDDQAEGRPTDSGTKPPEKLELTTKIPTSFDNLPLPNEGSSLTKRLERALGSAAPLLREIFVDFAPFLSKTLIGSHGQELLVGGLVTLKQSSSVVELVMLLCSQEWQNSLQKHAGLAFIELVNEGRLLAHATRDHIVRVANEAEFILTRMRAEDVQKHAEFESLCAQTVVERKDEEKLCDHLITSAKRRDHSIASVLREKIVNILTNKHGAWGQFPHDACEFWKLDSWEDDFRRRRRFVKNPHGSTHPEATLEASVESGSNENAINQARETFHAHLAHAKKGQQQQQPDFTDEELLMEERDFEQEFSGPVALSTSCKLISMGLAITGIMSITKTDLYFEMDEDDKDNKKLSPEVLAYMDHLHGKWHFSEIRAVFSRRYLLQNVAIEMFTANRTAVMFAFPDHLTLKKVVNALPRVGIGIRYGLNQARRMSLASGKQLFKLSNMTQKWQRREISNYDYLVYLNTVAGRSFNDLNQYPIFPWVIVNYESEELDLSQPNNFRDLSKPIGALNPARKKFFDERYASWEHEQIPPFHYGTHYSTAAFTLNWLIRVEPFTTLFLNMQGGKFDHANRTFFSINQAWKNCQTDTSDVKELIPEFYYLPEILVNQNRFNFGYQDGDVKVDDVLLPPWAKTPDDFVRINRMALESEFVSCQLHHWIDLIFGYKQKGPEAIRSTNVFYYLTYEGSVNLESMTDPIMKEAIENQIRSFGQTPTQLLTEPHPPRSSLMHLTPMMFSSVQDDLCMLMKFLSNSPITHVAGNTHPMVPTPAVITITCNHNFAVNKWNPNYQQQGTTPSSFSSDKHDKEAELPVLMDQLFTQNNNLHKRSLGDNFDQRLKVTHSSFVTTADNKFIFACGFWDKSFRLFSADSAKILQVIYGHFDIVTCITKSESNTNHDCYIVTGSKDCTVMVWQFNSRTQAIVGDIGTAEKPTPKATLTGHQTEVICLAVFSELGLVVSGSKNGPCLVHTLTGDLLRSLDPPKDCFSPELITMSKEGFILVKFDQGNICNFTINGRLLCHVKHKDSIMAMLLSNSGDYLITGGDNGVADVWRTHDLTLLYSYPKCDGNIHSLSLSHDEKLLLLGLGTGCLLVFFIDFNKWHYEYQERY